MPVPFARRIARFALSAGPLLGREAVATTVLRSIVDAIACLVGAHDATPVAVARDAALAFQALAPGSSVPSASMVGAQERVTLEAAAFVNGLAIRYLDYNDIYLSREAVHPSDSASVALALAEAYQLPGCRVIDAIARGYEVHCRLADSLCTRKNGWDHVVLNAIASAITAGMLLGLDEDALTNAVAIAATGNIALMETRVGELSMWKAAAAAYSARAGLFAAIHARYGLTGPMNAIDGKHGLFAQVTGPGDAALFDCEASSPRLLGLHLKAYPIGYFTQSAVDAALRLRDRFDASLTTRIDIETSAFGRLANADGPEKWRPRARETADHSLPYGVAVALLDGQVRKAQFTMSRMLASDVQSLMEKIVVHENHEFTTSYPQRACTRITLVQTGRPPCTAQIDHPRGHALNPMSDSDIEAKWDDLVPGSTSAVTVGELWRVPELSGPQLAQLLRRAIAVRPA